jgi:hypothetical protein
MLHGGVDGAEKFLSIEGLVEMGKCSELQGSLARSIVPMRGDHNDRQAGKIGQRDALQLPTIHPGHADVGDQTTGHPKSFSLEDFFRGTE